MPQKKGGMLETPQIRIARAILWAVDKKRKSNSIMDPDLIYISDIREKAGVNHANIHCFLSKYEPAGHIKPVRTLHNPKRFSVFRITDGFESILKI